MPGAIQSRFQSLSVGLGIALCAFLVLPALSQAAEVEPGPSLDFGPVTVGTSSPGQTTSFTNRRSEPIVVEGTPVVGTDAAEFSVSVDGCSGHVILPGEACEVTVIFSPEAKQGRIAELQLFVEGESAASVELSGEGVVKRLTVPAAVGFQPVTIGASSETELTVSNDGEAVVSISKLEIAGPNSGDFTITNDNCGGSVGPSMTCEVSLRFAPGASGEDQAEFKVISDGTPSEPTAELSGEGVAAEIEFEPPSHDFGLVEANSEGSETTLELRNTGAAQVHLNALGIFGSGSNEFFIGNSDCYGATLQPAQTCSLVVHFDPHNRGSYSAEIQVSAENGERFEAELTGVGGRPIVTPSPDPANFGEVAVGSAGVTRTITLTNTGELPAGFFIAILSGGDSESFHLVEENCTGRVINPGESCTAQIRFSPINSGARNATVSFIGDGEGALQVPLSGVGIAASATMAPASHDFGAQAEGAVGPPQSFILTNEGAATLEVSTTALSGLDADQFRLSTDTCAETTLAPGASCSLGVRFAPESLGTKSAVLRVRTSAGTRTASLGGEGVAAAASRSAKVSFRFPGSLRLPSKIGSPLKVATAKCVSSNPCLVKVSANLIGKVREGGKLMKRSIAAPRAQLRLGAGASDAVSVKIPEAARRFSDAARTQLIAHLNWSTATDTGKQKRGFRLGGQQP